MNVQETLDDRETKYGDFGVLAHHIQIRKEMNRQSPGWAKMTAVQREALDMGVVKDCRVLFGDPMHYNSWHDRAGYAVLVTEEFAKMQAKQPPGPAPTLPAGHPRDLDKDTPIFLDKAPKK